MNRTPNRTVGRRRSFKRNSLFRQIVYRISSFSLTESYFEFILRNYLKMVISAVWTAFYSDVPPMIIWIVRLETFWRPSNIKVSFSSSFIPFSSSEPDYSLISRKDFSQKSDQKPIKYRLIKMIKENQATIIQIIPVISKNSKYFNEIYYCYLNIVSRGPWTSDCIRKWLRFIVSSPSRICFF